MECRCQYGWVRRYEPLRLVLNRNCEKHGYLLDWEPNEEEEHDGVPRIPD